MLRREYFKRPSGFYYFMVRDEKKVSFTYGPFRDLVSLNYHADNHDIIKIYSLKKRLVFEAENLLNRIGFLIRWYGRLLRICQFMRFLPVFSVFVVNRYVRLCELKGYCYDRLIRRRQAVRNYRGRDV